MKTDAAASAAEIPGLVLRPYAGEADLPEMVRIQNAEWEADGIVLPRDRRGAARLVRQPVRAVPAAPRRDDRRGRRPHGRLRRSATGSTPTTGCASTAPAARSTRPGAGAASARALLRDSERRSAMLAATQPTDRPLVLGCFTDDRNVGGPRARAARRATSRCAGSSTWSARSWTSSCPRSSRCPTGSRCDRSTSRSTAPIWRADIEAFRDHWGGGDESEEALPPLPGRRRTSTRRCGSSPGTATRSPPPSVNTIYREENEALGIKRGWLDSVFTRRAVAQARPRLRAHRPQPPPAGRARHRGRRAGRRRRQPVRARCACTSRSASRHRARQRLAQAAGGGAHVTLIALPDAPAIPGLRFRHYRGEEDHPGHAPGLHGRPRARRPRGGH